MSKMGFTVTQSDVLNVMPKVTCSKEKSTIISKIKLVTYLTIKRVFDIVCSIIALVFLLPLALIIKIAYLLTGDKESIFFIQNRIGQYGKEFKFYKFRTMVPNADEELKKLLDSNKELAKEYKLNKKLKHDPRITKMGKWLRKTSLDEFPQFINVLFGQMAVIGNRPYLPREKEDMVEYFDDIVKTRGGIVSYWAVMGRSDVSFETRLKLEKYYSNHRSLLLDIKIFFKTFKVVLGRRGSR